MELIQRRRARIKYSFKKDEIEHSIVHRVQGIFGRASAKWKDDVQLWLSYVVFCKKWATKAQLSKVFSAMLAIHSNKPALWIMAAKWEMEDRLSSESARQLFLRALRFHPECPKLYQEYFRMELMNAEKLRKEKQEFEKADMDMGNFDHSEEILNGEFARIIYKNSISKIKGAEFHVSLLSIAQLFDFAKDLQKEIYDDLQALHTDDPLTWDYVARRELEIKSQAEEKPLSKQARAVELGRREERCCAVYEEAVKTLPTEAMWKCYINFCLERFSKKTSNVLLRGQRLERTMLAFRKAQEFKFLSEVQYKQWVRPWKTYSLPILCFIPRGLCWSLQVLNNQFVIFFHCEQVSLPLWVSWAEWSEGARSQEDTEEVFKKAILAVTGADSRTLKEKYLDRAYRSGGYKKARAVFKSLQERRPFSVDFFRKMMQFEKEQESCKMVNLREYYERALREFGSTDSDLWMDYIKEELNHPLGRPENCGQIYWRAMKMLQGQSAELFVAKHAMHQAGH
uniref:UTP6 small subunit processome component n=1 Tax=Jaculus jaculus TaxID=51337 RepID=A0A8C5KIU5_JACJA